MEPGTKINRWTVNDHPPVFRRGRWYIECTCECGTVREVERRSLETKSSGGCGRCNRRKKVDMPQDVEEEIKAEKIAAAAKHGAAVVYLMGKRFDLKEQRQI